MSKRAPAACVTCGADVCLHVSKSETDYVSQIEKLRQRIVELEREREERQKDQERLDNEFADQNLRLAEQVTRAEEDRDRLQERLDQLAAYGAGSGVELLAMLDGLRRQADDAQADALFALSMAREATAKLADLRAIFAEGPYESEGELASMLKEARLQLDAIEGYATSAPGRNPTPQDPGWSVALGAVMGLSHRLAVQTQRANEIERRLETVRSELTDVYHGREEARTRAYEAEAKLARVVGEGKP